jgi:hypothetical protein
VQRSVFKYGRYMGGVDTYDRYLSRFSIANGHSFKKWYKKLGLAVLHDITLNAFFTWRLAKGISNSRGTEARDAHMDFMSNLIRELLCTPWGEYEDESVLITNDLESLHAPKRSNILSFASPKPALRNLHCSPISGMFGSCSSACTKSYPGWPHRDFMDDAYENTCWGKFHKHYYPNNVFKQTLKSIGLNKRNEQVMWRKEFLDSFMTDQEREQIRQTQLLKSKASPYVTIDRLCFARASTTLTNEVHIQ